MLAVVGSATGVRFLSALARTGGGYQAGNSFELKL
jgi:hypothetical protein